ncbi:putative defense protein [Dermacentor silvarum]|uniref:putative defense protein n=1 Tax=Dermacentor silvarum TaxID=543639 RepID=UPI002100C51F|nr:putative defense protein [Dermacentor silvarum]
MQNFEFLVSAAVSMLVATMDVTARPSGAPRSACSTMLPRHGVEHHSGRTRYRLTQSDLDFEEDSLIAVNLTAMGRATFKGFLVKAIVDGEEEGDFLSGEDSQPVRGCPGFATHVDPHHKTHVALLWNPPSNEGTVTFV